MDSLAVAQIPSAVDSTLRATVGPAAEESLRTAFSQMLIPAYERSTKAMFEQIHATFTSGTTDITEAVSNQVRRPYCLRRPCRQADLCQNALAPHAPERSTLPPPPLFRSARASRRLQPSSSVLPISLPKPRPPSAPPLPMLLPQLLPRPLPPLAWRMPLHYLRTPTRRAPRHRPLLDPSSTRPATWAGKMAPHPPRQRVRELSPPILLPEAMRQQCCNTLSGRWSCRTCWLRGSTSELLRAHCR